MYPNVPAKFILLQKPLEGALRCMYGDQHRDVRTGALEPLVTTGEGQLIDAGPGSADRAAPALGITWTRASDGLYASAVEVRAEFARVLALSMQGSPPVALRGGGAFCKSAVLLATADSLAAAFTRALEEDDRALAQELGEAYTGAPIEAQIAALGMAWAMGPGFVAGYPKWAQAFRAGEFSTCADECDIMHPVNDSIASRNVLHRTLFANAAQVAAQGLDRTIVNYPSVLVAPTSPAPAPTEGAADDS